MEETLEYRIVDATVVIEGVTIVKQNIIYYRNEVEFSKEFFTGVIPDGYTEKVN